jgi:hypothetical protein
MVNSRDRFRQVKRLSEERDSGRFQEPVTEVTAEDGLMVSPALLQAGLDLSQSFHASLVFRIDSLVGRCQAGRRSDPRPTARAVDRSIKREAHLGRTSFSRYIGSR